MEQFTQPQKRPGILACPETPAHICLWLNSHTSGSNYKLNEGEGKPLQIVFPAKGRNTAKSPWKQALHNWRHLLRNSWPKLSHELQPLIYSSLRHFKSILQHLLSIYLTYSDTNLQLLGSLWPHIAPSELLRQIYVCCTDHEPLQLTSVFHQTSVT